MRILLAVLLFAVTNISFSQQPSIKILEFGKRVSIRGLSVVSNKVIWASGSSGSVARSVDGGATWTWMTVSGYEKRDFRDIEAFDKKTAIIIAVAEPAVILKTVDGGQTWKKVFEDAQKGVFLDAMDFSPDGKTGLVIGDPITDAPYLLYTRNRGDSWEKIEQPANPAVLAAGEAFFASSGSNIKIIDNIPWAVFISGGKRSRGFILSKAETNEWRYYVQGDSLPIMQGGESTGANSIAMQRGIGNTFNVVIVGGDFAKDTIARNNCVLLDMHGFLLNLRHPQTPPHGYRSCVIYLSKKKLLTCGTSGIDISTDGGNNWELISKESFHVCQKAKKGSAVFLAGSNGRIAKLQ